MRVLRWAVFAIGVALWATEEGSAKKIPRWWLKVAERQGPNACVVEEIPGTSKEFWTECRYWLNRKICGTKTRVRFECCEGFDQIDGEQGCTLVKPLKNLLETAEALGATKWAAYIRQSGLQDEFESAGAYTLFAPTNEAFDQMEDSLRNQVESYRGIPNNPILLYHIVPSKLRSDDFDGDQTIETRHQGHNIRINKYSNGMTTINCALLVRKDQEATNGIVHIIDGVLDPSVGIASNVADIVLSDGRFQVLAEMLETSGYINVLRTLQDSITILAPSDEAFQKLPDSRREKIINDREARLALLQNHIIPHVICESAITGEHRVRTMFNKRLTFNCDIDGAYVENTKLTGDFNLGKNGIIHMIDDVLLPDRAKNLIELAESRQLETFVQFVKNSGLEETLSHTGDYTFFVPDENAWLEMPPNLMARARRDPEYAGLMLRYHGAYGRHLTNAITDNQGIMSLDEENPVRLQVWRRALGVEDAKITDSDLEAQNGVIHIINKVIFPSNRTLQDALASIRRNSFYSFLDVVNRVKSQSPSLLSLGPGDDVFYTFFVPTDRAFEEYDQGELSRIMSSREDLERFVSSHVAVNMFPETSFEPGLIYSIEGLGANFNVKKSRDGKLSVNNANVLSSHMTANGVIHVIDKVFRPSDFQTYSSVKRTSVSTVTSTGDRSTRTQSTHTVTSTRNTSGRTHHRTSKTFNEDARNQYDKILPAYPQGSVIVGSTQREPETVLPPLKKRRKARRRGSLRHRAGRRKSAKSQTKSTTSSTTTSTTTPATTKHTTTTSTTPKTTTSSTTPSTTSSTTKITNVPTTTDQTTPSASSYYSNYRKTFAARHRPSYDNRNAKHDSSISRLHEAKEKADGVIHIVQGSRVPSTHEKKKHVNRNRSHYDYNRPVIQNEISSAYDNNGEHSTKHNFLRKNSTYRHYIKPSNLESTSSNRNFIPQYDKSYYTISNSTKVSFSNSSAALVPPTLTTYNKDWDVSFPSVSNMTYSYDKHGTNVTRMEYPSVLPNMNVVPGSHLQSSKTYSYSYSRTLDGKPVNPILHGDRFNFDNNNSSLSSFSTSDKRDNAANPVSQVGGRFSYVGHPYGDDVVGHSSEPLPFTSAGSSYVSRNSSSEREAIRPIPVPVGRGGNDIHRVSTVTHSKRVGVTRTVYTHPSRSSTYLSKSSRTFSFPINKTLIPAVGLNGKLHSDLLSAYAFTGEDRSFADGEEFSEARLPSEQIITVEQAKMLRRQSRRKRHHNRIKNRRGTKRGIRRGSRRRLHRRKPIKHAP